ncbi:MAG TPA: anti-sigma factor, partial [Algoriphagus sp.]|nr:anti-sigma factor [Algoriphagus sp.]
MVQKIQIACRTTALSELRDFLNQTLMDSRMSDSDILQVTLAVEEVCANLIIHSHSCNEEDHIVLSVEKDAEKLIFEIKDEGEAFNLLDYEMPDL